MYTRCGLAATAVCAALLVSSAAVAKPVCINKAGQGTNTTQDGAKFQAYEAILQATDWGMWAVWITSGAKVGDAASGYKVSNLKFKCTAGTGLGHTCIGSAKLCK